MLISKKVESSAAFAWQSQLKHRLMRMGTMTRTLRMTKTLTRMVAMVMMMTIAMAMVMMMEIAMAMIEAFFMKISLMLITIANKVDTISAQRRSIWKIQNETLIW